MANSGRTCSNPSSTKNGHPTGRGQSRRHASATGHNRLRRVVREAGPLEEHPTRSSTTMTRPRYGRATSSNDRSVAARAESRPVHIHTQAIPVTYTLFPLCRGNAIPVTYTLFPRGKAIQVYVTELPAGRLVRGARRRIGVDEVRFLRRHGAPRPDALLNRRARPISTAMPRRNAAQQPMATTISIGNISLHIMHADRAAPKPNKPRTTIPSTKPLPRRICTDNHSRNKLNANPGTM